jgi:hypothetical protein
MFLVTFLTSFVFISDADVAKLKEQWTAQCEKYREELTTAQKAAYERTIQQNKAELAASEKNLKELNAGRGVGGPGGRKGGQSMKGEPKRFRDLAIKDQKKEIADLKEKLKNAENEHNAAIAKIVFEKPHLGRTTGRGIDTSKIKVGDMGVFVGKVKVIQVIDDSNAIMQWDGKSFWVETPTSGFVDGQDYESPANSFNHVAGTKKYKSVAGSQRTIFHVKVIK